MGTPEDFSKETVSVFIVSTVFCHLRSVSETLKGAPEGLNATIQFLLWENERVPNTEIVEISRFLYRCLALDPQLRPSAKELLDDPWFADVRDE